MNQTCPRGATFCEICVSRRSAGRPSTREQHTEFENLIKQCSDKRVKGALETVWTDEKTKLLRTLLDQYIETHTQNTAM